MLIKHPEMTDLETVVLRIPLEKIMFREADSNGSDLPHLVLFICDITVHQKN